MNAHDHYQAGNLQAAVAAGLEDVKRQPGDINKRVYLCELLCLVGDLERADRQLDTVNEIDPQANLGVSLFRQLIRAEQARQDFYSVSRLPEFLDQQITPDLRRRLEAALLLREGKAEEAVTLLIQAEEQRPDVQGVCDGQPFDNFRDLDDLTASFFEVLTSTGKYYWIPMERVESIEFHPFARPRDLLWRRAHVIVRGGPDGEVFLPALYAGASADPNDQIRLGRTTEWRNQPGGPIRGFGQRMFLVGNEARAIIELTTLAITPPS